MFCRVQVFALNSCRIDQVSDETEDGSFLTTEEQVLGSDTDPSDGWKVEKGTFAAAGVLKPYQLQDDEIVPDDLYAFYQYLNAADLLMCTFTSADGSDVFRIAKNVGVRRINEPGWLKNMRMGYPILKISDNRSMICFPGLPDRGRFT